MPLTRFSHVQNRARRSCDGESGTETQEGFLYLAGISDLFTRTAVGWSMADSLHSQIGLDALEMAAPAAADRPRRRSFRPVHQPALQAAAAGGRRGALGGQPLRRSRQRARRELLVDARPRDALWQDLPHPSRARMSLFECIEGWFNSHRRHSSLGMLSQAEFERRWRAQLAQTFKRSDGAIPSGQAVDGSEFAEAVRLLFPKESRIPRIRRSGSGVGQLNGWPAHHDNAVDVGGLQRIAATSAVTSTDTGAMLTK